jgi:hypothetical protein
MAVVRWAFVCMQGCQSSHLLKTIAADLRSSHGIADCSRYDELCMTGLASEPYRG